VRERWPAIRERLQSQLLPAAELRDMLDAAGCPTHPAHIKLDMDAFKDSYRRCQMIRSRYTVLDFAIEAGVFEDCVEELFAPGGYWFEA
jgi:glycerol-1-phosphate dehydrogenase [NAD(P)+]